MTEHLSVDLEENAEGWFRARCNCGWDAGGVFPTAEDACDALMDHAYCTGYSQAMPALDQDDGTK